MRRKQMSDDDLVCWREEFRVEQLLINVLRKQRNKEYGGRLLID